MCVELYHAEPFRGLSFVEGRKMKLYNTLSKKTEEFKPLIPGQVSMYVCGPTVYDYLHIGNFRGAIFFNLVRNWLEHFGYKVKYVYNYTDIDDKIIKRAAEQGISPVDLTKKFITEFEKDFAALHLDKHTSNPRATEYIPQMVTAIEKLIQNGKAYVSEGEVLYAVEAFQSYGKLSGKKLDELEAGSRVEVNTKKKNPFDFLLWKPAKPGEPSWTSPWGAGRPGWHIECTCMIHGELGEQIDIHGGGIDLIFPHHENEIAQGEGVTGKPYAKYWMHNQFINFGDEKMSKSLGNVITARKFLEQYHGEILKFLILSVHYRSILQFTDTQIHQSIHSLGKIYSSLALAESFASKPVEGEPSADFSRILKKAAADLESGLNDDFNTPVVFAQIFEVLRAFNSSWVAGQKITEEHRKRAVAFIAWMNQHGKLLALFQEKPTNFLKQLDQILILEKNIDVAKVESLITDRVEARKNKNFAKADQIRAELTALEIEISDTPLGTVWTVKKS